MVKEKFERTKPYANIGTTGYAGHGKTTLTTAITFVLSKRFRSGEFVNYANIDKVLEERGRGVTVSTSHIEYETESHHYTHADCPGHVDYVKNMITGVAQMDRAILIVSTANGPIPQTREHILLPRQVGAPKIVVFLNKEDQVGDPELIELVETEVCSLLSEYEFDGDSTLIVVGSALRALEDSDGEWGDKIMKLMEEVNEYIPVSRRDTEHPFLVPVEDIFFIAERGTIATGHIERGVVKVNDNVEIVGLTEEKRTIVVIGVEVLEKMLNEAQAGDSIGVLLHGIQRDEIEREQVLATSGTTQPHTRFEAEVYILTKEEGGWHAPFLNDYRPQFYFRTTDTTGDTQLAEGIEVVMPGDNATSIVTLTIPIAMDEESRFAIHEGGRIVEARVVSKLLNQELRKTYKAGTERCLSFSLL